MDELAVAAGQDPVAFRLAHLSDQRARAVIESVTRKAGWKASEKGDGARGRGIAFAKYKNLATYVAVVAEIEIDRKSGRVRVPRTFAAAEPGQPQRGAGRVREDPLRLAEQRARLDTPDAVASRVPPGRARG